MIFPVGREGPRRPLQRDSLDREQYTEVSFGISDSLRSHPNPYYFSLPHPRMPRSCVKPVLLIVVLLLSVLQVQAIVPLGRLTVLSDPPNANVCVDAVRCDSTAATFILEGNTWHTINVTAPGYSPWSDLVYVPAGQGTAVTAELQLNPNTTGLRIFVRPGGGNVCLDHVQCQINAGTPGSTGFVEFTGIPPGFHTVTVDTTDGYQDYSTQAHVTMGDITNLVIELTPEAIPTGTIRVYVNPPGSTVCIDGGDCRVNVGGSGGTGTGFTDFTGVTVNIPHTISATEDLLAPATRQVMVSPDRLTTVTIVLEPIPVPTPEPTPLPVTMVPKPTQSPSGWASLLGALAICGLVILPGKKR